MRNTRRIRSLTSTLRGQLFTYSPVIGVSAEPPGGGKGMKATETRKIRELSHNGFRKLSEYTLS
jgi:hypothetical protein